MFNVINTNINNINNDDKNKSNNNFDDDNDNDDKDNCFLLSSSEVFISIITIHIYINNSMIE